MIKPTGNPAYYTISTSDGPDLVFAGWRLASTSSRTSVVEGPTRWSELCVYQTIGGQFVAVRRGKTTYPGEVEFSAANVCQTEDDILRHFGMGWLSKRLYAELGIDTTKEVA